MFSTAPRNRFFRDKTVKNTQIDIKVFPLWQQCWVPLVPAIVLHERLKLVQILDDFYVEFEIFHGLFSERPIPGPSEFSTLCFEIANTRAPGSMDHFVYLDG